MSKLFSHPAALLNSVRRIAAEAGELILDHYDEGGYTGAFYKEDGSPVTEADRLAEEQILAALNDLAGSVPAIGEEAVAAGTAPSIDGHDRFWLVDALDGTREFIAGGPEFTVNIGLVENGRAVMGVVYAPATGEMYYAHEAAGAFRALEDTGGEKSLRVRRPSHGGLTVMASKNRDPAKLNSFLEEYKVAKIIRRSSSLKICAIAAGRADLYPSLGDTCEWDTAAAHAVLSAAGGTITGLDGQPLTYGHQARGFLNPEFVAQGG